MRIEDTDKKRSSKEAIEQIFSSLKWLGLEWDEEVVFQSARKKRHVEIAEQLLNQGKAYRCFCTKEELDEKRRRAEALKINQRYDGTCHNLSREEIKGNLRENKPFSVRLRVEAGQVVFDDLIHGQTIIDNNVLDDFIILRPDETPVYQLAVVADDHDMGVTTVLRGDDHLSNTNKQILLYQALGWDVPRFGHLPLILGQDKVRLSKRHGATSVEEFKEQGLMAEALVNYLCLLGWSPGDDSEIMSREELIDQFSVQRINHTSAVFDLKKLYWINSKYLAKMTEDEIWNAVKNRLSAQDFSFSAEEADQLQYLSRLLQPRSQTLLELTEGMKVFFDDPENYEEKGVRKFFTQESFTIPFAEFYNLFKEQPGAIYRDVKAVEDFIRGFAQKKSVSAAKIIHPLRLALTGKTASPGIFELIVILGKERVLRRMKNALQYIYGASNR